RNKLARNRATDDFVDEQETMFPVELPLAGRAAGDGLGERVQIVRGQLFHVFVIGTGQRVQFDFAVTVLTLTAGLLDVLAFSEGLFADGFAISDLRTADVRLHVIFAQHAVHDNFQVQFAHAGDQRLAGIGLGGNAESWIFLSQTLQSDAKLVLVGFRFWLDRNGDNWSREFDGFENDRLILI